MGVWEGDLINLRVPSCSDTARENTTVEMKAREEEERTLQVF